MKYQERIFCQQTLINLRFPSHSMDMLSVSGLSKTFRSRKKEVKALDNVSFSIKKGEIFGLLGPNGAGKTTLISILTGLLLKDSGRVEIVGKDIDKEMSYIQNRINLVLGFTGIGMSLTVREFLNYFCLLYGLDNRKKRIEEAMDAVDITLKGDTLSSELSSGFKQRLMIAKSLLNRPDVLLLDEPTVGLDVEISIKIRALIKSLRKKGVAILLTTHNMGEVEELCDRIALISRGKILAIGTVGDIKKMIAVDKIIEVEVDNPLAFSRDMKGKEYVMESKLVEDMVHITVESYGHVRKVMSELSKSAYHIYSLRIVSPTLEEAFLEIVRKNEGRK